MSIFERIHAQADAAKAAGWAQADEWWRDRDLWADAGAHHSSTEYEAIEAIERQCGKTEQPDNVVPMPDGVSHVRDIPAPQRLPRRVPEPNTVNALCLPPLRSEPVIYAPEIGVWVFNLPAIHADIESSVEEWQSFAAYMDREYDKQIAELEERRALKSQPKPEHDWRRSRPRGRLYTP